MNPEFAKYILAMNLVIPYNQLSASDVQFVDYKIVSTCDAKLGKDADAHIQQIVFNRIISKFETEVVLYPELINDNESIARQYFYKTIELLSPLSPNNIIFSLTSSDSLHFRICKGDKEINLEVFFSKYEDNDNIEAVVNVYENKILVQSDFGSLLDLFNNIIYIKNSASKSTLTDFKYV